MENSDGIREVCVLDCTTITWSKECLTSVCRPWRTLNPLRRRNAVKKLSLLVGHVQEVEGMHFLERRSQFSVVDRYATVNISFQIMTVVRDFSPVNDGVRPGIT